MRRWQAKHLGDVDYRLPGAAVEHRVGKPREAIIGTSRWSSRLRGPPDTIAAPLSRPLLARAVVIQR
jgi:hypothetical protein